MLRIKKKELPWEQRLDNTLLPLQNQYPLGFTHLYTPPEGASKDHSQSQMRLQMRRLMPGGKCHLCSLSYPRQRPSRRSHDRILTVTKSPNKNHDGIQRNHHPAACRHLPSPSASPSHHLPFSLSILLSLPPSLPPSVIPLFLMFLHPSFGRCSQRQSEWWWHHRLPASELWDLRMLLECKWVHSVWRC